MNDEGMPAGVPLPDREQKRAALDLVNGAWVEARLSGVDGETIAEDLIERRQGCGHAAAGAQERPPAETLATGGLFADLCEPGLIFLLLRRLRGWNELLIRSDS